MQSGRAGLFWRCLRAGAEWAGLRVGWWLLALALALAARAIGGRPVDEKRANGGRCARALRRERQARGTEGRAGAWAGQTRGEAVVVMVLVMALMAVVMAVVMVVVLVGEVKGGRAR